MDGFGQVNNAVYFEYMDNAVNLHLLSRGVDSKYPRFVIETGCRFRRPLSFPSTIEVGLRVSKVGNSTAVYDLAFFDSEAEESAADATFVHCYIDLKTGKPTSIDSYVRDVLATLRPASL